MNSKESSGSNGKSFPLLRKAGKFVLKLDAFGLSLGRVSQDQQPHEAFLHLERFESRQDEEFNIVYYSEGKWIERDIESIVSFPEEERLLRDDKDENLYHAKGSLVDYFVSMVPNLEKETIELLRAEDKWKYKAAFEYREKRRKGKKRKSKSGSASRNKDIDDHDMSFEDDIQELDEIDDNKSSVTQAHINDSKNRSYVDEEDEDEDNGGDDDENENDYGDDSLRFKKGSLIVFENEDELLYGKVQHVFSKTRPDGTSASVVSLREKIPGLYEKVDILDLDMNYRVAVVPKETITYKKVLAAYIATDDPLKFVTWQSPAVRKRQEEAKYPPGGLVESTAKIDKPTSEREPVDRELNGKTKPPKIGSFGYIGVSRVTDEKRRFIAHVMIGSELRRVPGLFESPVEAALAHDEYSIAFLGNKAVLNFLPRHSTLSAYGFKHVDHS